MQGAETDKAVERDPANRPEPPQQRGAAGAGLLTRQLSSSVSASSRESSVGLGSAPRPQFTHFLCVSPDAPTNPVLYWIGNFDAKNTRFLLDGAQGPTKLDLGDVLYAPNLMKDAKVQSRMVWSTEWHAGCHASGAGQSCVCAQSQDMCPGAGQAASCASLRLSTELWPEQHPVCPTSCTRLWLVLATLCWGDTCAGA